MVKVLPAVVTLTVLKVSATKLLGQIVGILHLVGGGYAAVVWEHLRSLWRRLSRLRRSVLCDSQVPSRPTNVSHLASSCSLNADPYNVRAEELALEDCMLGVEIRRIWSERELVCCFDGRHLPGTPDGMFESWDGALTCVQVVRVPLRIELSLSDMEETLSNTVLIKVVKSQSWLRAAQIVPHDFVIFCWLPFLVAPELLCHAASLMTRVRTYDPRFSLRLRVPAQPDALFPVLFACNQDLQRSGSVSWSDVATYTSSDSQSNGDEEECMWDITWSWDEELTFVADEGTSTVGDEENCDGHVAGYPCSLGVEKVCAAASDSFGSGCNQGSLGVGGDG